MILLSYNESSTVLSLNEKLQDIENRNLGLIPFPQEKGRKEWYSFPI